MMRVYFRKQIISLKKTVIFQIILELFTCQLPSGGIAYVVTHTELIKLIENVAFIQLM